MQMFCKPADNVKYLTKIPKTTDYYSIRQHLDEELAPFTKWRIALCAYDVHVQYKLNQIENLSQRFSTFQEVDMLTLKQIRFSFITSISTPGILCLWLFS